MCGVKRENISTPGDMDKVPNDLSLGKTSPEVIQQMESSPRMYRKAQIENQYMIVQSKQNSTGHSTAAHNPTYFTVKEDDEVPATVDDRQFVTTPPAYLGSPASRFY